MSKRSKYENITDKFEHLLTALFLNTSPFLIIGMTFYRMRCNGREIHVRDKVLLGIFSDLPKYRKNDGIDYSALRAAIERRARNVDGHVVATSVHGCIDLDGIHKYDGSVVVPVTGDYMASFGRKTTWMGEVLLVDSKIIARWQEQK